MNELIVLVQQETLSFQNNITIRATQQNYSCCKFIFDDSWTGYTKTAVFYTEPSEPRLVSLSCMEDNVCCAQCTMPWETLRKKGNLYIGVFGVREGVVRPTNFAAYGISSGSYVEGIAGTPTPDVYSQMVALMEKTATDAQSAKTAAEIAQTTLDTFLEQSGLDEVRFSNHFEFPNQGVESILYVAVDENKIYRWDGNLLTYVECNNELTTLAGISGGTA